MSKIKHYLFIGLVALPATIAYGDITQNDIDAAIDKDRLSHPYLYFSEEDKPGMRDRIKNDPESRDIMARMIAEANRLLYTPVEQNIPIQGKNTRAGWTEHDRDGKYEAYYSSIRDNALHLAFVYQMTGDRKYAEKGFEFADAFCDLTTWTIRAHEFPIIYERIMPWGVHDDQVNFSFDHMNGDSSRRMAAVYDWLYPALNRAQKDRIRGALLEKSITRVRGNYEYHWWAAAYRCNWCGVCNSGLGLASLALLTEDPQLTDVVAESYNRINRMLNELGVDGGWQEGGGYWSYAIHTSTFFADALKRATNGRYNLFRNERFANNPVTFGIHIATPQGLGLNFEDSASRRNGAPSLLNKIVTETGNGEAAWYREKFFGPGDDMFDIIWPKANVRPEPPKRNSMHFRTIGWWTLRNDHSDMSKVFVAGKAGMNDDPHHGHLDIGHFVIYWQNQAFIRDLGSGAYDEKYFNDARWDYPQASSAGHNVVFVNDEKQIPAKMYKQPWKEGIGGKVLAFETYGNRDYVLMDPTNAYPKKEMKSWRRHVTLEKPNITVVLDELRSAVDASIEVRFHSGVATDIQKSFVLLKGNNGTMALIPVLDGSFEIIPGRHACQPVNATRGFFWEPYFGTVFTAKSENTVIGTIILPVQNENEAAAICKSVQSSRDQAGGFSLSFTQAGKTYRYVFEKQESGLLLKK